MSISPWSLAGSVEKFVKALPVEQAMKSYTAIETAKINQRMNSTADQQQNFNNPGQPQNPQAKTGQGVTLPGGLSMKTAAIGLGGVGLLLGLLKIMKVF